MRRHLEDVRALTSRALIHSQSLSPNKKGSLIFKYQIDSVKSSRGTAQDKRLKKWDNILCALVKINCRKNEFDEGSSSPSGHKEAIQGSWRDGNAVC
uniref:Uncharacterized protein n=1 Tax=Knipowitschia caucasica TaxID=637954 RepID=A0AAV2M741_KNICA